MGVLGNMGPVGIEWLNPETGKWQPYDRCGYEQAGRFLGYGQNALYYRAVDPVTRLPLEFNERTIREIDTTEWNEAEIAVLNALVTLVTKRHS